jgi:hypothetical protein
MSSTNPYSTRCEAARGMCQAVGHNRSEISRLFTVVGVESDSVSKK